MVWLLTNDVPADVAPEKVPSDKVPVGNTSFL
jgi:hypothetical protein